MESAQYIELYTKEELSDAYLMYLPMRPLDAGLQYALSLQTDGAYNTSNYSNPGVWAGFRRQWWCG